MKKICVIIVLYNPNLNKLKHVITSLKYQVNKIYVFDNSQCRTTNYELIKTIKSEIPIDYITENKNLGIGKAQNILLKKAISEQFNFAILSDQDTIYPQHYVINILNTEIWFKNRTIAVVPVRGMNLPDKLKPRISIETYSGCIKSTSQYYSDVVEVSHAIASGMVLNLMYLNEVGYMSEELFIDWVDNEWCWRARDMGYKIYALNDIVINHELGDGERKLALGKPITLRSNQRRYYILRNALYLILYSRLSFKYKVYLTKKAVAEVLFNILLAFEGNRNKYFLKSIRDGISKNLGEGI